MLPFDEDDFPMPGCMQNLSGHTFLADVILESDFSFIDNHYHSDLTSEQEILVVPKCTGPVECKPMYFEDCADDIRIELSLTTQ